MLSNLLSKDISPLNNLHLGWVSFWVTYWVSSLFIFPKVEPETNPELSRSTLYKNLLTHKVISFFWAFLFDKVPAVITRNNAWSQFLGIYAYIFVLSDVSVYAIHRLLHTKWFYGSHKTHHTYIHAEPVGAIYESKFEMLVGSPLLNMIVFRNLAMSTTEIVVMSAIFSFNSLRIHSGVAWSITGNDWLSTAKKWIFDDSFHAAHHIKRKCNYGLSGLTDWIFGTYTNGSKVIAEAR